MRVRRLGFLRMNRPYGGVSKRVRPQCSTYFWGPGRAKVLVGIFGLGGFGLICSSPPAVVWLGLNEGCIMLNAKD